MPRSLPSLLTLCLNYVQKVDRSAQVSFSFMTSVKWICKIIFPDLRLEIWLNIKHFSIAIRYLEAIGGVATLIGTPLLVNLLLLNTNDNSKIDFLAILSISGSCSQKSRTKLNLTDFGWTVWFSVKPFQSQLPFKVEKSRIFKVTISYNCTAKMFLK